MAVREIALKLLTEYEACGKYVNLSLSSHQVLSLSREEKSFLTALLYTSVEHKITYDYYIAALSGRSISDITDRAKNILRIGLSQIIDMDKIPDFAAVNETVKLAKNSGERAFVNGVLRRAVREKDSLPLPPKEKNFARYLSVKYSFPLWIVKLFISELGGEGAEQLLTCFSSIPPTDLTVNTTKISVAEYTEKLKAVGYSPIPSPLSDINIRIYASVDPRTLPGFTEGEFFVQDASCAAAVSILSPKSGEVVADVCSAPGGKSFAAAVLMKNVGTIHAFDIHESKLSLISGGAERLSLDIINSGVRDALAPDESLKSGLDKVICDVPCSGLGVLGKKPDLRYRSEEGSSELPSLQYEILSASAGYLKLGGRLLYSTCTLNRAENEAVVERFLSENSDFSAVPFNLSNINAESGMLTLYPHINHTDGFFIALIEKRK